jgi:SpoVK/Ycf46/Vps4 family AAA+-type ATPase
MKIYSTFLITYLFTQSMSLSYGMEMERIPRELSNQDTPISLEQLESMLPGSQEPREENLSETLTKALIKSLNKSSSRKFPEYSYEKALDFIDQCALDDAYENCPENLKYKLADIEDYSNRKLVNSHGLKDIANRIILVGPPGGGKTTLGYAIAYHCKLPFSFIRAPELCNSFKDSCPDIINDLFDPYIKRNKLGLIIIDEANAFIKKMKKKHDSDTGAVEQLWAKFDEALSLNPKLMIILTTNEIKCFPETLLTRFRGRRVEINLPSEDRKLSLINKFFENNGGAEQNLIENIAKKTAPLSIREITLMLCSARGNAYSRCERGNIGFKITAADIDKELKNFVKEFQEDVWNKRKKNFKKKFLKAWPYIYQTGLFAVGSYMAWKLYKLQIEQALKTHEVSMTQQAKFHEENKTMTKAHHHESLAQSDRHHREALFQSRELHNDANSWKNQMKHGMAAFIGAAGGAVILAAAAAAAPKILAYTSVSPEAAKLAASIGMAVTVSEPISPTSQYYAELTQSESFAKPVEAILSINNPQNGALTGWCSII